MEEQALINEVRNLLDHSQDSAYAGDMTRANARLVEIRELLNAQPELDAEDDTVIEQKLNPDDG